MQKENCIKNIADSLSWLELRIKKYNKLHFYDINTSSETFFGNLLNLIYDINLKNQNEITQKQTDYIDLYDKKNNIFIQVTSQTRSQKIKDTIIGIEKLDYINKETKLIMFLLQKKKKYTSTTSSSKINFDWKKDILDIDDLILKMNSLSLNKLKKIEKYISTNLKQTTFKKQTISFEEETMIKIIEVLSAKKEIKKGKKLNSTIDPERKIDKRFKQFSNQIKQIFKGIAPVYIIPYSNIMKSKIVNEVTLILVEEHLKNESITILRKNNDNPLESLEKLVIWLKNLVSSHGSTYDEGAIKFFLVQQIISCNVFPNIEDSEVN